MSVFTQHPPKIESLATEITEAIMEDGRVNFTMSNTQDTVVLQFTALTLTPQIQKAASEALDEDELEDDINSAPAIRPLSPRKPKSKPGPKR